MSADVVCGLRDVHALSDGGVSTAHLEQPVLQGDVTDHHGEEHPHLIVPGIRDDLGVSQCPRATRVRASQH